MADLFQHGLPTLSMEKTKNFFKYMKKSKFRSLFIRNFLFALSIFLIALFTAITLNDLWLSVFGMIALLYFIYVALNVQRIEQENLYEEVTGVIAGYKEKAKADLLIPKFISEECSFVVETDGKKLYEIMLPRLELKIRGILLQEGMNPKHWVGRQITFYYRDDPSKPFHYDICKRKAEFKDEEDNSKA